jgi:hypothetical protein
MENIQKAQPKSRSTCEKYNELKISLFGRLFRLIGWWFGFTGLYATFAVCPFCGQQGCTVGMASAGTVGAFFVLCIQDWKRFFVFFRHKLNRKEKL